VAFGKQDLQVLEATLGKKSFFFGEVPSNLDVVAFAHLSQITYLDKSVEYELRDWMLENCPGLVALVERMKERCFTDWEQMTTSLKMNTHIPEPEPEKVEEKEPADKDNAEKKEEPEKITKSDEKAK